LMHTPNTCWCAIIDKTLYTSSVKDQQQVLQCVLATCLLPCSMLASRPHSKLHTTKSMPQLQAAVPSSHRNQRTQVFYIRNPARKLCTSGIQHASYVHQESSLADTAIRQAAAYTWRALHAHRRDAWLLRVSAESTAARAKGCLHRHPMPWKPTRVVYSKNTQQQALPVLVGATIWAGRNVGRSSTTHAAAKQTS
jgi:hypothetical protein